MTITNEFAAKLYNGRSKPCKVNQIYLGGQAIQYKIEWPNGLIETYTSDEFWGMNPVRIN